ncbi:hypothetical protein T265_08539 [Opisthorchis viverrini]|uniref:Uncharacterized protein n=1 Tax=Opisthorchis viverrini TaxID=6198 RepID=A0A074Z8R1_OPIVI|nr:hypothetical protein T265_08539 [Opisthorchis viverrini]KER23596.1 hypothetical protein T265_08539 [Opisthorchis viverrini]
MDLGESIGNDEKTSNHQRQRVDGFIMHISALSKAFYESGAPNLKRLYIETGYNRGTQPLVEQANC